MALYKVDSDTADLTKVAGGTLYADNPIGSILPYGGTVAPNGFFLCQGQALSRTDYKELFSVIGTSFGVGDGSTTFNLPDLRGEFLRGAGTNSHANQGNGGTVGDHQDATRHLRNNWVLRTAILYHGVEKNSSDPTRYQPVSADGFDYTRTGDVMPYRYEIQGTPTISETATKDGYYTSRPTNTSVNYIIKAKHTPVPADFADSLVGYLGQETNYNLYPWSHTRTQDGEDISQDIVIERDGWYSIDYTLTNSTDTNHTFTLRDFDSQGEVHTVMRCHYGKSGTFRQTYLVPLKAGTYRYSHGGIGSLSVYMNRRDFAN